MTLSLFWGCLHFYVILIYFEVAFIWGEFHFEDTSFSGCLHFEVAFIFKTLTQPRLNLTKPKLGLTRKWLYTNTHQHPHHNHSNHHHTNSMLAMENSQAQPKPQLKPSWGWTESYSAFLSVFSVSRDFNFNPKTYPSWTLQNLVLFNYFFEPLPSSIIIPRGSDNAHQGFHSPDLCL